MLARRRTRANAAHITGADASARVLAIDGHLYAANVPSPLSAEERAALKAQYECSATALTERGETYLERVIFPELDETNARLGAIDPFATAETLSGAALADHLLDCLRWYERAWTLHWLRPPDDPRERFIKLYQQLTGDSDRQSAGELFSYEPNLMTAALTGVMSLARLLQRGVVEASDEFQAALAGVLAVQGLRCGEGAGNERDVMAPSWREDPAIPIALARQFATQDLDALERARAATIARRDARVAEIRAAIADEETRRRFDFWLDAARRALRAFEDHNYKIDSAAAALLRLAILGAARRLQSVGILSDTEEVWLLGAQELAGALRETGAESESDGSVWRERVHARAAEYAWQRAQTAPEWIGAPAPAGEAGRGPGGAGAPPAQAAVTTAQTTPPDDVVLTGQTGSRGLATGTVKLLERNDVVPVVEPGDVLVARNASPLWAPAFAVAAAVVLDGGALFQHALLTCREYGVPAVIGTREATQKLTAGQRVTVDATHGWVLPAV
jgi:phosphohistidine swiveling domain-containing protein